VAMAASGGTSVGSARAVGGDLWPAAASPIPDLGPIPVALPAGCATCPNAPTCFPGQVVALTRPLATAPAAPIIPRDAILMHGFRGVCMNCHVIVPDRPIGRDAVPLHGFRGVCSNCHTILDVAGKPLATPGQ
ncbi:MAG: hypothetical protein ABH877_01640, partial [bacterium]